MFKNWKVFLISLLMLMSWSCENPTGPLENPWEQAGEIEILLESSRDIDFTKTAIGVDHYKYGGKNATYWTVAGENRWVASIFLVCDPQPYFLVTACYKLETDKFYLRRKDVGNWIRLTCIVDHPGSYPSDCDGKDLKFIFNRGIVENPSGCGY